MTSTRKMLLGTAAATMAVTAGTSTGALAADAARGWNGSRCSSSNLQRSKDQPGNCLGLFDVRPVAGLRDEARRGLRKPRRDD